MSSAGRRKACQESGKYIGSKEVYSTSVILLRNNIQHFWWWLIGQLASVVVVAMPMSVNDFNTNLISKISLYLKALIQ